MLNTLWSSVKRLTVGEKIKDVGEVTGERGARATVDIRRVTSGEAFVTLSVTSNFTVEINGRTKTYAYLDEAAAEELAAHLARAIKQKETIA